MLKKIAFILLMTQFQIAFGWWGTGHELTAQIAENNINQNTAVAVNRLLSQHYLFPIADANDYLPNPAALMERLDSMVLASTWLDTIKMYRWQGEGGYELSKSYKRLHYLDIAFNLSLKCESTDFQENMHQAMQEHPINSVSAIQSSIKTLTDHQTSLMEQAIAMRVLLHVMGDIHQPMHNSEPQFNGENTYGANNLIFNKNNYPSYQKIMSNQYDIKTINIGVMHAYWDAILGTVTQLVETSNSPYDPDGGNLWDKYKKEYFTILHTVAQQFALNYATSPQVNAKLNTQVTPASWSLDGVTMGCSALSAAEDNTFNYDYSVQSGKRKIIAEFKKDKESYQNHWREIIKTQVYIGGMRLSYLLDALYTPSMAHESFLNLVNSIKTNSQIPTLSQLLADSSKNR